MVPPLESSPELAGAILGPSPQGYAWPLPPGSPSPPVPLLLMEKVIRGILLSEHTQSWQHIVGRSQPPGRVSGEGGRDEGKGRNEHLMFKGSPEGVTELIQASMQQ